MEEQAEKKEKSNRIYLIIIIIETILIGLLGWLFFSQKTRVETVEKEKLVFVEKSQSLQDELTALKTEYENLEISDKKLKRDYDAKMKMIDSLMVLAKKHDGDAYQIYQLKKETETLRRIMKHFVVQIDSLGRLNKEIVAQKEKVITELSEEKFKTKELTKEKEDLQNTVNMGSVLKANGIKVSGIKTKSGGKKEVETKSAKRVEKIKITFTLGENRIAKSGDKTVFIRIVTPDGKEMAKSLDESNTFSFNGSKGYYATKTMVNYKNSDTPVTVYTAKSDIKFLPGKYLIEIASDGVVIGQTQLILE
ncbi:MAG: hypothetical protein IT233_08410 [Bacteroidia bacterium]|nr:hypothetical protein [Bacteroidia bacterium]